MRGNSNIVYGVKAHKGISMDRTKMRKQRYKKLGSGKGKKVGFFESIGLKITGFRDGRRGFPHLTDDNVWYSTFMNREVNSYEEFCSYTWGSLQIENEDEYAKLEELMGGMRQKRACLEVEREKFVVLCQKEKNVEICRKRGEDMLSDAQVGARRKIEHEKKLVPIKEKIATMEQELKVAEDAFANMHSKLVEDDNTTRLICHRVRNHILMRVDVYWNSALMCHTDGAVMPVVPSLELRNNAEEAYLEPHKELMKRAAAIQEEIHDETHEKEVA